MDGFELDRADTAALNAAQRKCAQIVRKAAGNIYYAFIFLPKAQRRGIEALYAFCRAGDDAADDLSPDPSSRLELLRRRLDLCYDARYTDPQTLALANAIRQFRLEREHFDDLLLGIESDLSITRYPSFKELRLYCYRVASTVGLLCLKIFGADSDAAREYAVQLGIGMQLTNILRDIREDWERGRIYLPLEDLARFGVKGDDLFSHDQHDRLVQLVQWEVRRAEEHFEAAQNVMPASLKSKLVAARIMGGIYRAILERIKRLESYEQRVELSRMEKINIARSLILE